MGHARYRWFVLAVGTFAQAATSAYFQGLAGIGPALRAEHGLGLAALGLFLVCPTIGIIATLVAWGPVADRYGERPVMSAGLVGAGACLAGAATTDGATGQATLLVLAGAFGASVSTASGRAVMTWFTGERRGVAMGIRQCAVPAGSGLAALALPPLVEAHGVPAAFVALAATCLLAAAAVAVVVKEPPQPAPAAATATATATRQVLADRRLWRLSGASALLIVPQFTMVVLLVVLLHDGKGVSAAAAAVVLSVAQAAGAISRILVGAWSDRVQARMRPLRTIALACAAGSVAVAAAYFGPLSLLVVVLVVVTGTTVCWNGLAFTAAGELAPPGRAATAMGVQNTANFVSAALTPPCVGLIVAGAGWGPAFCLVAVAPLAAAVLLNPILEPSRRAERPGRLRVESDTAAFEGE